MIDVRNDRKISDFLHINDKMTAFIKTMRLYRI
jgi:hypothetical protein